MLKKIAILSLSLGILGATSANAGQFEDCLKDASDRQQSTDFEVSLCMKAETARLLKEVQQVYNKVANDTFFAAWNKGNGMYKGNVRDTYNAWLVYRNNFCDLIAVASKNAGGTEESNREDCRLKLTQEQLDSINGVMTAKETVIH